jgi:hypothetical protein
MIYQIDKLFDVACAIVTAQRIAEKAISAIPLYYRPKKISLGLDADQHLLFNGFMGLRAFSFLSGLRVLSVFNDLRDLLGFSGPRPNLDISVNKSILPLWSQILPSSK